MFRLAMLRKMSIYWHFIFVCLLGPFALKEGLIHGVYDKFIGGRLSQSLIYGGGLNPRVGLTFGFLRYPMFVY